MRFAYRLRDARQARGLSADCRACGLLLSFARTRAFRTEAPGRGYSIHAGIPLGAAMKLKQLQALRVGRRNRQPARRGRASLRDPARRQPRDHRSGVGTWRSAADADGARGIVDRVRRVHPETGAAHRPRGRAHLRRRRCRARRRRGSLCIAITPVSATEAFLDAVTAFAAERPDVQLSILELRRAQIVAGLRTAAWISPCIRNTACWRTPRRTTGWNRCMRSARRWLSAADMRVRWMSAPRPAGAALDGAGRGQR